MNRKLRQWILDSVEVEMKSIYRRQQELPMDVPFIDRYSDYYVNLITRMMNVLNEEYAEVKAPDIKRSELLAIARGMQIFNDEHQGTFYGVNTNENALYVAALYYLCDYEAVANLVLKECNIEQLPSKAAKLIYYIIAGGNTEAEVEGAGFILNLLIDNETAGFEDLYARIKTQCDEMSFDSEDEFFDTNLVLHILAKFKDDNIRTDLQTYRDDIDWKEYIEYSVSKHIFTLLKSQRHALSKGLLSFDRSFSLRMPTSAGKSFLTELLVYQELETNGAAKILYLAPLRSLSHELKVKYEKISRALGFSFRCIYGGSSITVTESYLQDADMLITTPETFMTLEGAVENMLSMFSLVICDEGQLLVSPGRGLNYELLLSRLKKHDDIRFLFISAIIPNIGSINSWLGGDENEVGDSQYRPCTIRYAEFYEEKGGLSINVYENLDKPKLFSIPHFVNAGECIGTSLTSQKNKACLLALKSLDAGSVMLYTSFKTGPAGCVKYGESVLNILEGGKLPSPLTYLSRKQRLQQSRISEFITYLFGPDYFQSKFVALGFAVHHGSIPQEIRELVETGFSKGALRLVVCNSTLAEGVNFPVKTLVLGDVRHPTGRGLMNKEVLLNVIGRAGRAGEETYGLVIASQDKFWFVVKAAKGEDLKPAEGMLNELIDAILDSEREEGRQLTDEEINAIIDSKELSDSIDRMITLSTDNFAIEDASADEISSSSLTYHLSSAPRQQKLNSIFAARFNYLSSMDEEVFNIYKETKIEPHILNKLGSSIGDENCFSTVVESQFATDDWLNRMIMLVTDIEEVEDEDLTREILKMWMKGYKYIDIAKALSLPIDVLVDYIEWLTSDFLLASKSLVRYMSVRFGVENESLNLWPTYVERGLCSPYQAMLLKSGLSDRIALHAISHYLQDKEWEIDDKDMLRNALRKQREDVMEYLTELGLPEISLSRVARFLK